MIVSKIMCQTQKSQQLSLLAPILVLVLMITFAESRFTQKSATEWCAQRAGLKESDINGYQLRNDNCSVDCKTQQATLLSYHVQDGLKCRDDDKSRCFMGLCLKEDEMSALETKGLYSIDIYIKSARVEDRDPAPGTGGSDALVMVDVAKDGYPNYSDGNTICHTYIIQDNNNPRWNGGRGFLCRPMPVMKTCRLKFVVLDSDKPIVQPDLLGTVSETVEELMNRGTRRLKFENASDNYYLEVEVKGSEYKGKN